MDPYTNANGVQIAIDRFRVRVFPRLDPVFDQYAARAKLADKIDARSGATRTCTVVVSEQEAVLLAAAFGYELSGGLGPAVAFVPEPARLFVGAGVELLCYDLARPRRLWRDHADCGIHGWEVIDDVVLMSAELELAAWDTAGDKLWTTFVEPPWSYSIKGDQVQLDVMGEITRFGLRTGRRARGS